MIRTVPLSIEEIERRAGVPLSDDLLYRLCLRDAIAEVLAIERAHGLYLPAILEPPVPMKTFRY